MISQAFWRRLITLLMITLLLIPGMVIISPTPALADGDTIINNDCRYTINPKCGNTNITSGEAAAIATGTALGAVAGSGATLVVVSSAGSITGLGAAGITSGLAAIGATAGGGMAAGVVMTAAAPIVGAALVGYGTYLAWGWFSNS